MTRLNLLWPTILMLSVACAPETATPQGSASSAAQPQLTSSSSGAATTQSPGLINPSAATTPPKSATPAAAPAAPPAAATPGIAAGAAGATPSAPPASVPARAEGVPAPAAPPAAAPAAAAPGAAPAAPPAVPPAGAAPAAPGGAMGSGGGTPAEKYCDVKYEPHCGYGKPMRHASRDACVADFNASPNQQGCKNMHMDTSIAGTAAACNGMPSEFCFAIHCLHAAGITDQTGVTYCKNM